VSNEVKKVYIINIIQLLIYGISVTIVFLYRENSPSWTSFLFLAGILIGNFIPLKFRTSFYSNEPGLYLKNHTRKLETIIEIVITCIGLFLVIFIPVFYSQ